MSRETRTVETLSLDELVALTEYAEKRHRALMFSPRGSEWARRHGLARRELETRLDEMFADGRRDQEDGE